MSTTNTDRKARFEQHLVEILNFGAVNLAMGIGYRSGAFEAMDAIGRAAPIAEIADKSGLDGRYLKEWLGVMVSGGVIDLIDDADNGEQYLLPPEHADLITRRAGSANLGVYTQETPLLTACAWEDVLAGMQTGEGVPYARYPRFQAFMGELADAKHREVLVDVFLPSVDDGDIVSAMADGIHVCDVGCGEGMAINLMAGVFPKSRFVGLDISAEAIGAARREVEAAGLANVEFLSVDVTDPATAGKFSEGFDYITAFDAIHDQTRPADALKQIYSMLTPGGAFSMVDIAANTRLVDNLDHPMAPFLYTVSLMHCMPVGLVSGGAGLGMMWGREKAVEMLQAAGFQSIAVNEIPQDPFNLHFYSKKINRPGVPGTGR
ncbi:MAG: class I SAM-dependent methyltransferase [Gammaproteobacteria bacterium]|nr:class I SAM-dependent methyltransferase [Gammaproteobacteria bacterium]